MNRFAIAAAVAGAGLALAPAQAAHLYSYAVSGTVTGTQSVYNPNQIGCNGGGPGSIYCTGFGPYSDTVGTWVSIVSDDGTGSFDVGYIHAAGEYTGTIVGGFDADGTPHFSGVGLSYGWQVGNQYKQGTAATFSATLLAVDGVALPEPASWAMLIVGFGAIGGAMRRRRVTAAFA